MKYVLLGVEDAPSEAVLKRLVGEHPSDLSVSNTIGMQGWTLLRKKIGSFAQTSQHMPAIVLTDLDDRECAPALVQDWMRGITFPTPDLLLRVAVREVEAWLIADHEATRSLLQLPGLMVPPEADDVRDPKEWLLLQAQRSPRSVRSELMRYEGAKLKQGLGYNDALVAMARSDWSPARAAERSDSLRRAREAIAQLASR